MAASQAAAPPGVVMVNALVNLLRDSYSRDDMSVDIEECFARFRQWLGIHNNIFAITPVNMQQRSNMFYQVQHYNGSMTFQQ